MFAQKQQAKRMRCVLCTAWHAITLYLLKVSVTMSRMYSPNVLVDTSSKRAIACPTFVYGLACDYVVFAKAFNHHVLNCFPNVPVNAKSKRIIGCPTFVYGLACDYVVFAEGLSHHVQNSFPNACVRFVCACVRVFVCADFNSSLTWGRPVPCHG